jgi:hypothetical protein
MRLLAVLAAASLVLAGCGDDDGGEDAREDTTEAADLEAGGTTEGPGAPRGTVATVARRSPRASTCS